MIMIRVTPRISLHIVVESYQRYAIKKKPCLKHIKARNYVAWSNPEHTEDSSMCLLWGLEGWDGLVPVLGIILGMGPPSLPHDKTTASKKGLPHPLVFRGYWQPESKGNIPLGDRPIPRHPYHTLAQRGSTHSISHRPRNLRHNFFLNE